MTSTAGLVKKLKGPKANAVILSDGILKTIGFHGVTAIAQQAGADQAATGPAAPAGGTGATAGAYDTAANRDLMITLVNETRTLINELRQDLVDLGLISGAA